MTNKENYIESLKWQQDQVRSEIAVLQNEIQEMFKKIETKQEQLESIIKLLAAEGDKNADKELSNLLDVSIADIVFEFLRNANGKKPTHYQNLADAIMAQGILIAGKNPAANLLSHISRDNRFVRTAPGTYGLKEWGIKEMPTRKRKTRKRK